MTYKNVSNVKQLLSGLILLKQTGYHPWRWHHTWVLDSWWCCLMSWKVPEHVSESSLPFFQCSRTLKQLHYVTWPDHGVPESIPSILQMLEEMRSYQTRADAPVCIHCRSDFSEHMYLEVLACWAAQHLRCAVTAVLAVAGLESCVSSTTLGTSWRTRWSFTLPQLQTGIPFCLHGANVHALF